MSETKCPNQFTETFKITRSKELLELFRSSVPNFSYLEERGWFMRNHELQNKLLHVVAMGLEAEVNVMADNFSEHLDEIICPRFLETSDRTKMFTIFRTSNVPDYFYLEERLWFMRDPVIQEKLFQVINLGLGSKVNVTSPDFSEHLDNLINGNEIVN